MDHPVRLAHAISPEPRPCKICKSALNLFGVADFSHRGKMSNGIEPPLTGMPVYCPRCGRCGFLFTEAFDDWTTEEFSEHIYNEEYLLIDFEYRFDRPAANAARLIELFGKQCKTLSLLDYGCGNGVMIDQLRKAASRIAKATIQ